MSSLSKLILSAKVATGSWPPPDAIHGMRYQAGQVLLAVRHFVAVAQSLELALTSTIPAALDEEFEVKGTELSDSELISRLDHNCEVIVNHIASLVTKITRERTISTSLIDHVRKTINEIGQFMSLVEDIQFDQTLDTEGLVPDFLAKKESLYSVVNELVTASSAGDDGFVGSAGHGAVANTLGIMLETSTQVLENVEIVLVAVKLLVDHKELILQQSLYNSIGGGGSGGNYGDKGVSSAPVTGDELDNLQRRAQNLSFVEGVPARRTSGGSSHSRTSSHNDYTSQNTSRQHQPPPSPRVTRNRTASGDLRVDPSYRKSSLPQNYPGVRRGSQGSFHAPVSSGPNGPTSGDTLSSSTKLAHFFGEGSIPLNSARLSQDVRTSCAFLSCVLLLIFFLGCWTTLVPEEGSKLRDFIQHGGCC